MAEQFKSVNSKPVSAQRRDSRGECLHEEKKTSVRSSRPAVCILRGKRMDQLPHCTVGVF